MISAAGNILHAVVQLLWPETCACCGTNASLSGGLCDGCQRSMASLAALEYCPRCASTLGPGLAAGADGCWACPRPALRFARAVRVGPYTGPLRAGIHALKYRRQGASGGRLGRLLGEAVTARCAGERIDAVVAVPMHWLRRLARGRDHAAELSRAVAGRLGLPVVQGLVRVRNTPPQVHLAASRRAENVREAFAVPHPGEVASASVLLVDDVMTTGATANEATRTLLAAGAERVLLAVLARAEPPVAYSSRLAAPP